ncbi:MAG: cytochrome c oxidase accessory protein CcoG [Alphaproteobacteria bacterium]|nr:cytochrome c oxidase accessory protein CcoG [Alphaproteobacteria bacterium]
MSVFSGTRKWIYTRNIAGRYQKLHRWSGRALIAFLFVAPWLSWGGHPLVRIDLPARRLYLVGQIFTASDGFLIALTGLLAAFMLFFVSALFGRLWCGYFCPQTVFLEEWVRRVENLVEGDGPTRWRRDEGPWNADKIARKSAKVVILAALAFALGMTVLSYFAGAWNLWTGAAGAADYTMVGVIVAGALADWLWFREQLCIYLCPYARFQSALTDENSLMVGFNPEAKIEKGRDAAEHGNCIDCKKCVTVCPMGIDIRDGFQLECINCARCVDACVDVMGKLGKPTLVRYTTIAMDEGKPMKIVRPRTVVYGTIVTGIAAVLLGSILLHNPIEVTVNRSPGTLFQIDADGHVRNTYMLKVVNNDPVKKHAFAIGVQGLPDVKVSVPPLILEPGEDRTVPLVVRVPTDKVENTRSFDIVVHTDGEERTVHTTFKGPAHGGQG